MKILVFLLLCSIGIFFITKEDSTPAIIEVGKNEGQQNCVAPNNSTDDSHQHKGCCISSGRATYILGQQTEPLQP
ncbi:hypothetical protein [Aestuariibaculum suncheonense]|uniref:Uncharacterized protein n=1 Tax=Aestuariibaculum suncheonense TaxID=1028745 RepID=A0A8J6QBZ5_9FLAO|nr:hypothetical protein [Aestuariibaculum suncheonense]MBD0834282.1 hypothetical protein [Aestuariibaculum suncheonense]